MQLKNTRERYGLITQFFHWIIVGLIVTQFVLAERAEDAESLLITHRSVGMTILMMAVLRLLWRFTNPQPAPLAAGKKWQEQLASVMHWALYALIFMTPLVGWLMSSAEGEPVSWFGAFEFPSFIAANEARAEQLEEIHETLATGILALSVLHILTALKHHFIDKDNALRRMLPMKLK